MVSFHCSLDANALASYSHYSALDRKGFGRGWPCGAAELVAAEGRHVQAPLVAGMVVGLVAATISVLWERIAYAGIADFAELPRRGLFSTMYMGRAPDAFR